MGGNSLRGVNAYAALRENGPKLVTRRQRLRGITRIQPKPRYRASWLTWHYEKTGQNSLRGVMAYVALRENAPKLVTRRRGLRGITRKQPKTRYAASWLMWHYEKTAQNSLRGVMAYVALRENSPKLVTRRHGLRGITRKRPKTRYAASEIRALRLHRVAEGVAIVFGAEDLLYQIFREGKYFRYLPGIQFISVL